MLRVFILTIALTTAKAQNYKEPYSAASESQKRFAIQNRYDDTGPGAKTPEYAYNTYRTLEEALVSYIDDPDTKLPDRERAKVEKFVNTDFSQPIRELPKTVEEYTGYKQSSRQSLYPQPIRPLQPVVQENPFIQRDPSQYQQYKPGNLFVQEPKYYLDFRGSDMRQTLQSEKVEPYRLQNINYSPLSHVQYTKEVELRDQNPQYTYSYGVHDKRTGDSKAAHETRNGGAVKGYYTFVDPDGKQRTVHYTADDRFGFRATVQRTHMNTQ